MSGTGIGSCWKAMLLGEVQIHREAMVPLEDMAVKVNERKKRERLRILWR